MKTKLTLQYLPISCFSVILGLSGLVFALQNCEEILQMNRNISSGLLYAVILLFFYLSGLYFMKILHHRSAVLEEINHPVLLNFFPAFTINLVLISTALLEINPTISKVLWSTGTSLHFLLTLTILSVWTRRTNIKLSHFNPSWFIPVVGNIIIPIAGARHFSLEFIWFFFSIGIFFWFALFTIFLYRIFFHAPLSEQITPTLFILIAPPAVGSVSYTVLNGGIDNFTRLLYFFALFMLILLLTQIDLFLKLKFFMSWWAYTFPLAAVTLATAMMYKQSGHVFYKILFFPLLGFLVLVIILLVYLTLRALFNSSSS
ncbi:MAG: SLAC1 anion channel family protein [Clostridia bacterium]|jgi:tellurite resistance protein|nr:SLAC1 anion channel family protein [Clostridia bacterium]